MNKFTYIILSACLSGLLIFFLNSCQKEETDTYPIAKKISFQLTSSTNFAVKNIGGVKPEMQLRLLITKENRQTGYTNTILDTILLYSELRKVPLFPDQIEIDTTISTTPAKEILTCGYTYINKIADKTNTQYVSESVSDAATEKTIHIQL